MSDMMNEFLVESADRLDLMDRHLLTLEGSPDDETLLTEIFRSLHTIKGSCGFYGFDHLERAAHSAENLLSLLRDGTLAVDQPIVDALLATVDTIRLVLGSIERTGQEGTADTEGLIAGLDALAGAGPTTGADQSGSEPVTGATVETSDDPAGTGGIEPWPDTDAEDEPEVAQDRGPEIDRSDPPGGRLGDLLVGAGDVEREDVELASAEQGLGDRRSIGEILVDQGTASPEAVARAIAAQSSPSNLSDSTIRVDVALLDQLMNLVGELVLSRNEMVRLATERDDPVFGPPSQRLNLVTSELQERIMQTRMQPINSVWSKLPRIVHNLANQLGKEVAVEMTGRETELDRTIIEAVREPLTHIVGNVVDHGIEDPETRQAAGKDRMGRLRLSARHEGEQVTIEVSDDGRGIDPERIRAKAIDRGLIPAAEAGAMTEAEAIHLIFLPGLSTGAARSNGTGHDDGLDVVKSNLERIGGSIELRSQVGTGTTFVVKIPLTLAIIPALTILAGGNRYAIPQVNVLELVRLREGGPDRIEDIHGTPVYRLRGKLLPIVDLRQQLGLAPIEQRTTNIAVVEIDTVRFGLIVDGIEDNGEIVVKPLGQQVKDLKLFSGATILGDGAVALILDLLGLADQAGLSASGPLVDEADPMGAVERSGQRPDNEAMIIVAVGNDERVAIDLAEIDRLEEIPCEAVERSDGRPVVQYRGAAMPLIDLGPVIGLGGSALTDNRRINVVVCRFGGRTIGLAVDRILDIVHADAVQPTDKPGTIIVEGMVTDIVAPETIITAALPALHRVEERGPADAVTADASAGEPDVVAAAGHSR